MFIWLYSIMLPVYLATGNALLAYRVGVLAHFLGGFVFIVGAFAMPLVMRIVPTGALFGSLSGAAMSFLVLQSMDGVLQMPLVGWVSLVVLFVIYLGRVETKLPSALIAIVVGAALAWATGSMGTDAVAASVAHVGAYLPAFAPQIFSPEVVGAVVPFAPIIIVFSLNECITGIQGVEQARECGDEHFTATQPLVIAGVSGMVGALFGNPLATGLYWGYPGWKEAGAGTGYHLGIVALYALVCLTGLTAIITAIVPTPVVMPILVFLGVSSYAQAYQVVDRRHYPAAIMASLPLVMSFVSQNAAAGELQGFGAFANGAAFVGILVGCLFVFVIDNDWAKASVTCLVALGLTLVGMIHSPMPILTSGYVFQTDFVVAYAALALAFLAMRLTGFNRAARGRRR